MPIVEDAEPGEPRGGHHVERRSMAGIDPTFVAAQILVRLRRMPEVPNSIVERAHSMWDADRDLPALLAWLDQALAPYDEADVVECDCGQILVDPAEWVGKAVMVCDRCGSRFGVESRGAGEWSMWALPAEA